MCIPVNAVTGFLALNYDRKVDNIGEALEALGAGGKGIVIHAFDREAQEDLKTATTKVEFDRVRTAIRRNGGLVAGIYLVKQEKIAEVSKGSIFRDPYLRRLNKPCALRVPVVELVSVSQEKQQDGFAMWYLVRENTHDTIRREYPAEGQLLARFFAPEAAITKWERALQGALDIQEATKTREKKAGNPFRNGEYSSLVSSILGLSTLRDRSFMPWNSEMDFQPRRSRHKEDGFEYLRNGIREMIPGVEIEIMDLGIDQDLSGFYKRR